MQLPACPLWVLCCCRSGWQQHRPQAQHNPLLQVLLQQHQQEQILRQDRQQWRS
jgi:hypothetical protein